MFSTPIPPILFFPFSQLDGLMDSWRLPYSNNNKKKNSFTIWQSFSSFFQITRWCILKSWEMVNSNNSIPSCWTTIHLWNCCLTTQLPNFNLIYFRNGLSCFFVALLSSSTMAELLFLFCFIYGLALFERNELDWLENQITKILVPFLAIPFHQQIWPASFSFL